MGATFTKYSGTAEQYIREFLDPNGTLDESPTSEAEARSMWAELEDVFAEDGGTGISEEEFVAAVARMQEQFRERRKCRNCGKVGPIAEDETDPEPDADEMILDARGLVCLNYYVCGACLEEARSD
jgi:hypothetical protein